MGKLLFLLLIAAVAWVFFKKQQIAKRSTPPESDADASNGARNATKATVAATEKMVACSACGVFMPESDSVMLNGKISCPEPARCAHRPS
jgi:uncharacterized protein